MTWLGRELDVCFGTAANQWNLAGLRVHLVYTNPTFGYDAAHQVTLAQKILQRDKEIIWTLVDHNNEFDQYISSSLISALNTYSSGTFGATISDNHRRAWVSLSIASGNATNITRILNQVRAIRALLPEGCLAEPFNGSEMLGYYSWNPFDGNFAKFAADNGFTFPNWTTITDNFRQVVRQMRDIWGAGKFLGSPDDSQFLGRHVYSYAGDSTATPRQTNTGVDGAQLVSELGAEQRTSGGVTDERGYWISRKVYDVCRPDLPRSTEFPFRRICIHGLGDAGYFNDTWPTVGGTRVFFNLDSNGNYAANTFDAFLASKGGSFPGYDALWTSEGSTNNEPKLRQALIQIAKGMNG